MTGIFLFAVIGAWVWICLRITRRLFPSIPDQPRRKWVGRIVFAILLLVPVADEIVGGFQFRALCREKAVFRFGVEKPQGRTTRVIVNRPNEIVPGKILRIDRLNFTYVDIYTNEEVVEFDEYVAKGGVLIRALGISESDAPLTMDSSCSPQKERGEVANRTFNFSVIN